jgi:hypothetical protein
VAGLRRGPDGFSGGVLRAWKTEEKIRFFRIKFRQTERPIWPDTDFLT